MFGSLTKNSFKTVKYSYFESFIIVSYNNENMTLCAYYMYIVVGMLQLGIHT